MTASGTVIFTAMLDFQSACSSAPPGYACPRRWKKCEDQDVYMLEAVIKDGAPLTSAPDKCVLHPNGSGTTLFGRPSDPHANYTISESTRSAYLSKTKTKLSEVLNNQVTSLRKEGSEC